MDFVTNKMIAREQIRMEDIILNDNKAYEKVIDKDGNLIKQQLKDVNMAYDDMGKMGLEEYYGRFYNINLHKIVPLNYIPVILSMEIFTLYMPVDLFLFDVWGFQIFYKIEAKNFDHKEGIFRIICEEDILKARFNASFWIGVKCRIVQLIETEIISSSFDNKEITCYLYGSKDGKVSLEIPDDDIKNISKYNITKIIHPRTRYPIIHYDFRVPQKEKISRGNTYMGDFLKIEDFIKYCKHLGIQIERRTIEKYSSMKMFPKPYKGKIKNKQVNVYHKDWIKYLEKIEEYKKKGITHLNKIKQVESAFFMGANNYDLPARTVQS